MEGILWKSIECRRQARGYTYITSKEGNNEILKHMRTPGGTRGAHKETRANLRIIEALPWRS